MLRLPGRAEPRTTTVFTGKINTFPPGPPYDVRFDLNVSNSITLADVLKYIPVMKASCVF